MPIHQLSDYSDINLFMGTPTALLQIPEESKRNALFMHFNDSSQIFEIIYYNPLGQRIPIPINHSIFEHVIKKIIDLANQRSIEVDIAQNPAMLHLNPKDIQGIFPFILDNYIKTEQEYAQLFFTNNPDKKFNRKETGLTHSYLFDNEEGIIQLAHKAECRATWSKTIPTQDIFANFPDNTSGAYVMVQIQKYDPPVLYYLAKMEGASAQEVTKKPDISFFREFQFSTRGLSKEELEDIPKQLHQSDTTNAYGEGGMGRVKKTVKIQPISTKFATKIQKLKGNRTARNKTVEKTKAEARILSDLSLGSADVQITEDKTYMHMQAKGTPLSTKVLYASPEQKLDYAIKFLISVDRLHTGADSKTHTGYAHRDLKPDNVLVDDAGQFTLIDYGLATSDLITKSQDADGTLLYAPLDQSVINHYTKHFIPQRFEVTDSDSKVKQVLNAEDSEDEDLIEEWGLFNEEEIDALNDQEEKIDVENKSSNSNDSLPPTWNFCLAQPHLCITQNYLEDDKIAALRTLYNNCPAATEKESIFTAEDFAHLPEPIRDILKTDTIAPLLTTERRQETESFFAAVLIMYQQYPHQTNDEYQHMIENLREDLAQQQQIISNYMVAPKENKLKRRTITPELDKSLNESELNQPSIEHKKLKPKMSFSEGSFGKMGSVWKKWKQKFRGTSASISPTSVEDTPKMDFDTAKKSDRKL